MAKLEDITVGASVTGLTGTAPVSVIAVAWHGTIAITVTFKDSAGVLADQMLYREDEERIAIADGAPPYSFSADANALRLAAEAYRISLAHLFDPYLAVHTSAIEPLPHQITAVYQEMLRRLPLRYILADDPGAGKTIMTGLLIRELIARGDLKRCMIVSPGNLAEQWQDELYRKFNLKFEILTTERIESAATGNAFTETNLCIARLDKLSRSDEIQQKLRVSDWDLIVCDEAHKMSATVWGSEVKYTKRFQLGTLLSGITRHFLLLTATPHNGKDKDFQLFMSLIDQDRFEGGARNSNRAVDVSDVMRRLVKEDLLKFDGTPLFPERIATTAKYDLSPPEAALYHAVTEYVCEEFNRADKLDGKRKSTVGFALTVLQRRLASSPEAIYQSLKRRRERLESRLAEERLGRYATDDSPFDYEEYDDDDLPPSELEDAEEKLADQASAAKSIEELEAEIATLKTLERMAGDVRASGVDRKWDELSRLLQDDGSMFDGEGSREKLIIFTEHRDTLSYLSRQIRSIVGGGDSAVITIHGGMLRDERRKAEAIFKQDKEARVLVATDAAGEGINLQRAHLMVNYDLPWNPNRLEQRFGRIHRIGQTEVCHLWNLVARETREGMVFQRLFDKLEQEREALKGKVFNVLGKATFDNKPLKDLILEAIRYNNDPEVRDRLFRVVDASLDREELFRMLDEGSLTGEVMDASQVASIREDMERMEARRLQPHYIEEFFLDAFKSVGGKIKPREKGRYEVASVPFTIRNRDTQAACGDPVLPRYERVCFDKQLQNVPGQPLADLIAPGHPLLEATISLTRERNADTMRRGAVFVDDNDLGTEARLLFFIEDSVQDGTQLPNGNKRTISKHVHFVEIREDGKTANAGYAPYLDYRAAEDGEQRAALAFLSTSTQKWLQKDVESAAINHAIANIIPAHLAETRERKIRLIDKTKKAVKERLTTEIQYWDSRSRELREQEDAGKTNSKLNSQMAARRAEDLAARMQKRLADLETEKQISAAPPTVACGALVIPIGLMNKLTANAEIDATPTAAETADAAARREVELAAMKAVMEIETTLGFTPTDVSAEKRGYDVESKIPQEKRGENKDAPTLRFIEVKGRAKGADTVTVTKNELRIAINSPSEFILAIVEVDGGATNTVYLKHQFQERPGIAVAGVTYNMQKLIEDSEVILEREAHTPPSPP